MIRSLLLSSRISKSFVYSSFSAFGIIIAQSVDIRIDMINASFDWLLLIVRSIGVTIPISLREFNDNGSYSSIPTKTFSSSFNYYIPIQKTVHWGRIVKNPNGKEVENTTNGF